MTSRVSVIHPSQPRIGVGTGSNYDSILLRSFQQRRQPTFRRDGGTQLGGSLKRRRRRRYHRKYKRNPKRYRSTKYQLR